jgi:transcriptional regulator with XRE-family HTH domain
MSRPKKEGQCWQQLVDLRTHAGMTQEDMAKTFHVTPITYSRWETKKCFPDMDTIEAIALYFDCSIDYLFGLKKPGELTPEQRENLLAAADTIYAILGEDGDPTPEDLKPKSGRNVKK